VFDMPGLRAQPAGVHVGKSHAVMYQYLPI